MSQVAPRAIALQEANKLGLTDAGSVLAAANAFVDFILAGDVPATTQGIPLALKPAAALKPTKAAKPVAAPKPAEPETEAEAVTVGSVVDSLLKAKKRDEAVALLKKYGATSVSGVKAAKAAEFIAEGLEILNAEGEADLTE
jgi:hypothetical protein